MEPSEFTHGHTGERVAFSGDYSATCCATVKQLTAGESFPNCSEHGETNWSLIPPFVQTDWSTAALVAHWKHLRSQRAHVVLAQGATLGRASVYGISPSGITSEEAFGTPRLQSYPDILLQAAIIVPGDKTSEGHMIEAVGPAWFEILKQLERDPAFLYRFSEYDREFEELIAGAYKRDGWPEVVLTPRRGDKGRDIIASKPGFASIRFVDQVKAYAPNHRVTADDVRALVGVLTLEPNISKGIVTTTSQFAPGIEKDKNIRRLMPFRLELRDGKQLSNWLLKICKTNS